MTLRPSQGTVKGSSMPMDLSRWRSSGRYRKTFAWHYAKVRCRLKACVPFCRRTYAPAVQGRIHSMAFDATAAAFHLEFTLDPSVAADTEIYFNEDLHYPNGYRVVLAPPDAVSWSYVERNRIVVSVKRHTSLAQLDGTRITIGIQRIPSKPQRVQTL